MRIFFFADYCIPIHAGSLDERPLGGTETGLIHLSRVLHERGHEVKVFTSEASPPPSPPEYPQYLPASALPLSGSCDLFVAVQSAPSIFQNVEASKIIYWTGDGPEQFTTFGIGDRRFRERVDLVLGVTDWHKKTLASQSGFPDEKIAVIRNGIAITNFQEEITREKNRLIFTSAPHRGLQLALNAFDLVKQAVPDLSLHIFSGFDLYNREAPFSGPQTATFEALKERCEKTDGCVLHGNVIQSELAKEYQKSSLYIYPATVSETSCITAIEAKAAGCPAVVSSLGGLPETVGRDGVVIPGEPASEVFMQQFAETILKLLQDNGAREKLSTQAQESAEEHYSWKVVTDRFEAIVASLFANQ